MDTFKTKMVQALILLVLLAVLAFAGCSTVPGAAPTATPPTPAPQVVKTCTLQGCGPTLNLIFSGAYVGEFSLEGAADGQKLEVHCIGSQGRYPQGHFQQPSYIECTGQGVRFINFAPAALTVTLRQGDQVTTQAFRPDYQVEQPNGPGCPPECKAAELIFHLPTSAAPLLTPNAGETLQLVWPSLEKVEPAQPAPGSRVKLSGRGGYYACGLGGCDESARSFKIYLDGQLLMEPLVCYVNHCEVELKLPVDISTGSHTPSTEGGSKVEFQVEQPK